jgi:hypothetical protein
MYAGLFTATRPTELRHIAARPAFAAVGAAAAALTVPVPLPVVVVCLHTPFQIM